MSLTNLRPFREMNPQPIGMAFLAVLAVLLLLAFNISKLPFTGGTGYSAALPRAEGLYKGDRVMIGGVVVGKVTSIGLEGTHVRVGFSITDTAAHLGRDTHASVEIATLLGNKYLSLEPQGPGSWPHDKELPLSRTAAAYDVEPALQGLGRTTGQIDTQRLAHALDAISAAFKNTPASTRSMLAGLSRLSETIASRDAELTSLLQHADTLTGVLAQRRAAFVQIFGDGDRLLQMLQQRRAVVDELLSNTADMAEQLSGLVHDNQASIGPALRRIHSVLALLNSHQDELDQIVKELYVFVRGEVDATGSGPWFDGAAINATNPFQANALQGYVPSGHPRTLGDLLGVPYAQRVVRGR
ncbi:MAG TPA: MlaD family protein [Mycobacteriales bacterium]|nr:MlaD family protein [Mycobacteriales bacterium]